MANFKRQKKDANHKHIVDFLRYNGVWVYETEHTLTDLICKKAPEETGFLEIKVEGSKAKYTHTQLHFLATCAAPVGIAKNEVEALKFARHPREFGLSQKQKNALLGYITVNEKKFYQPSEIEKVLEIKK